MSRPRGALTAEQIAQLEKLAAHLTLEQIADFFNVSSRTLRRRMHNDARILSAYKKGRAAAIDEVARSLLDLAKAKNLTAIIFYLKTQAGWRETEAAPDTSDISKLSDRELEKRRERVGLVR